MPQCNPSDPTRISRGGGAYDASARIGCRLKTPSNALLSGDILVVEACGRVQWVVAWRRRMKSQSVSVGPASEMTYTVSCGALNSTQTKLCRSRELAAGSKPPTIPYCPVRFPL